MARKIPFITILSALFCTCFFAFTNKAPSNECLHLTDHQGYLTLCHEAACRRDVFQGFKRNPIYTLFHENVSYDEGYDFLQRIKNQSPELLDDELLERVRRIDCLGSPFVFTYEPVGPFSPSTLHHLMVASDLKRAFGAMEKIRVIEIGGGHGGLCKVLHEVFDIESYTMIGQPQALALAKKHLGDLGLSHIQFVRPENVDFEPSDLLVSVDGFSESCAMLQKRYIKRLVAASKRGYLAYHNYPKHYGFAPLSKEALIKKMRKKQPSLQVKGEEPAFFWKTPEKQGERQYL